MCKETDIMTSLFKVSMDAKHTVLEEIIPIFNKYNKKSNFTKNTENILCLLSYITNYFYDFTFNNELLQMSLITSKCVAQLNIPDTINIYENNIANLKTHVASISKYNRCVDLLQNDEKDIINKYVKQTMKKIEFYEVFISYLNERYQQFKRESSFDYNSIPGPMNKFN